MRHHIHSLQALAAAEDMDGIRSYLDEMSKHRLLQTAPMQYCEHASLNAVLVYYCDWVRHLGADVDVKAAVPQYININNAELCSMVGNLLENALHASQRLPPEQRQVRVMARMLSPAMLGIVVENNYDGVLKKQSGILHSTKHEGVGVGLVSIETAVHKYSGSLNIETQNHVFRVNVLLNL